jgi:hypothetical protein
MRDHAIKSRWSTLPVVTLCALFMAGCGGGDGRAAGLASEERVARCVQAWNSDATLRRATAAGWRVRRRDVLVEQDRAGRCVIALDGAAARAQFGPWGEAVGAGPWTWVRAGDRWTMLAPHTAAEYRRQYAAACTRLRRLGDPPNARITDAHGTLTLTVDTPHTANISAITSG